MPDGEEGMMEYDEERDGGGERGASAGAPRDRTEGAAETGPTTLTAKAYERELARLQIELAKLQEWIRVQGLKVVVIFEGRDAAGKGGAIKRIKAVQYSYEHLEDMPEIRDWTWTGG